MISMTASVDVEDAKAYYSEFRGEPPLREEIVADRDDVWVEAYRKMACTFGFEIEQSDTDICHSLQDTYVWHYDGSGPFETALPPGTYPGVKLREFIEQCRRTPNCRWQWRNQFSTPRVRGDVGCGSHIHFRPRQDVEYIYRQWAEAWAAAHNTLVECVPLMIPMFAWGTPMHEFSFRDSALRWAGIKTRRLNALAMWQFLSEDYLGHPYQDVALNRKIVEKPLTLELRLNESHPGIAYETSILLSRIIRKCFERGMESPKLRNRLGVLQAIDSAVLYSIANHQDLYECLDASLAPDTFGAIEFLPRREIPGLKSRYNGWGPLFDDILKTYGHSYPPMARVCRLFLHRGHPHANSTAVWNVFEPYGEFAWDQDIPSR